MIHSITKNSDENIQRQAVNSKGGIIDLTGAVITITVKQFGDASTTLFSKSSDDTSEIEILDEDRGLFIVKILASDTSSLDFSKLYCLEQIAVGAKTYSNAFFIRLKGVSTGIPIESFVLSPAKYVVWKMIDGATPSRILKAGFSGNVTAAVDGTEVTITSANLELDGAGKLESNRTFTTSSSDTGSIVFSFSDVTGTISFWWGDPTKINISNSGYVASAGGSGQIYSGSSTARIALGNTLTSEDIVVWIDTTQNTAYFWNGSEWI